MRVGRWVDGLWCLSWFQITQKEIWTWYQDGTTFTAIVGSASEPRRSGQPTEVISFLISVPTISEKRAADLEESTEQETGVSRIRRFWGWSSLTLTPRSGTW